MTIWTSGYVTDVSYTYGYYSELNPLRVRLAFLNAGLACPDIVSACELGFGQGLSANIHASASGSSWWGTDFNPVQASFAREIAKASGASIQLFDDSFSEFSSREMPDFDYIGLHGIWSWISEENRTVIVDFIRRKLRLGGVLYISYNTLPGWGAFAPIRHLMNQHAEVIGSMGRGTVTRINDAVDFTTRLLATNPLYARANPQVAERVKKLTQHNRHYLAHEYFNRDWHPMHFDTMARWLEPAKLQYACSANYLDHMEAINITAEQQKFLNDIPDGTFRQTVRDFMVNQQFRRDYWVKGARHLNSIERSESLLQQRVILSCQVADIKLTVQGAVGEAKLSEQVYKPIIEVLSDRKPHSINELRIAIKGEENSFLKALQAVLVLTAQGNIQPVQSEETISKAIKSSQKINHHFLTLAKGSADVSFLASPVTGGGIQVGRVQQLFLLAIAQGKRQPHQWVEDAWETLRSQGSRIVKAGNTLQSDNENLAELAKMAANFQTGTLPVLKDLKVM